MEVKLFRPRSAVLAVFSLGLLLVPSGAFAAAEVHRLSLAISGTPTQLNAGDFNDVIDFYNRVVLTPPPRSFEPLDKVKFTWLFDSELRYFVTRNMSINAGVGQLRASSAKEYLPALSQAINVRAEIVTVPVHLGATYYLQPYNQGDFQARLLVSGGVVQYSHTRMTFLQQLSGVDPISSAELGGSFKESITQDGPGYYAEGGVHMFFAARYSVLLSAFYRSGELAGFVDERTGLPVANPQTGEPFRLDVGGIGLRLAAVIGL